MLYIWDSSLSYFDSLHDANHFSSNSAYLFKQNYDLLSHHHIRVPKLYYIDLSHQQFPFEFALVQYIAGGELEPLLYDATSDSNALVLDLKENIRKLHTLQSPVVGDLMYSRPNHFSCKAYVKASLDQVLDYLFKNYEPIAKLEAKLLLLSNQLYEAIEERHLYTLIHFELGPNHVMVDEKGQTYLIDFEGMKYFDLEYEYSFLKLRFGKYYPLLPSFPIDEKRLNYYLFYHHLSAIEGAHYLLTQGYEDLEDIQNMISSNYEAIYQNYL